jgi:hypothetical protein
MPAAISVTERHAYYRAALRGLGEEQGRFPGVPRQMQGPRIDGPTTRGSCEPSIARACSPTKPKRPRKPRAPKNPTT